MIREELPINQPKLAETTEQLLEMHRWMGEAGGDRWFVANDDHGNPASACRLYEKEGTGLGQVEDVATLREARQRGLARAVVLAAIAASREAGHEHTFIAAVADDWPQLLYARLGFEPVGRLPWFRKKPPGDPRVALRPARHALRKSRFEPATVAGCRYRFVRTGLGPENVSRARRSLHLLLRVRST